jgi:hypothetical protein
MRTKSISAVLPAMQIVHRLRSQLSLRQMRFTVRGHTSPAKKAGASGW